jgi:hypothetical protein
MTELFENRKMRNIGRESWNGFDMSIRKPDWNPTIHSLYPLVDRVEPNRVRRRFDTSVPSEGLETISNSTLRRVEFIFLRKVKLRLVRGFRDLFCTPAFVFMDLPNSYLVGSQLPN